MKNIIIFFFTFISFSGFSDHYVWNQKANFPNNPRHRTSALTIGNKGYLGMGHVNSGTVSTGYKDWWEYDPATNAWTQKANYPLERYAMAGFTIGNKGYLGTGNEQGLGGRNEFYEFDPIANTWTAKAFFPVAGEGKVGFAISGFGYMGLSGSDGLYKYNPTLNTWSLVLTSIPGSDYSFSFVINNKAYILPAFSNNLYEYNPLTGSVVNKAPFIGTPRFAGVSFALQNQGYVGLGWEWGGDLKDVYSYDPITDVWDTITKSFPGIRRHWLAQFVIGNNAYLGTGSNGTNLNDLWCYEWKVSVGVNEYEKGGEINIFPNPASSYLVININEQLLNLKPSIKIFTLGGKEIFSQLLFDQKTILDINQISSGIYIYSISTFDSKIIKSKQIIIY